MILTPTRRALHAAALALACGAAAPAAQALEFVFTDIGGTPMSAAQLGAFQAAGRYWAGQLSDPVTVYLDVAFEDLGSGVLGGTDANTTTASYAAVRSALVHDATSALDATAVAHLQPGPALTFTATQGDLSSRLDGDGSANNSLLRLTTADAKALGLPAGTSVSNPDATITFATGYASTFAYSRAGGVAGNQIDFLTVAEHEIGHALGFISGVDDIDRCAGPANPCGLPDTARRFENAAWYQPLDLFRYSAPGLIDVTVGGSKTFSVDGGATSIESFSTGAVHGDGWQASHFGTADLTLMRPYVGYGPGPDATAADLAAFDAIGWDLAAAVPEPAAVALWLAGGAGIGGVAARRRRRTG